MLVITIISLVVAAGMTILAWHLLRREQQRSDARVAALSAAIDAADDARLHYPEEDESTPVAVTSLFATERTAMQGRPLLKVAIGFAMAVALIVVVAMAGDRHDTPEVQQASATDDALELLSMRHARNEDALTVTGFVRNSASTPSDRLVAVVFAFDRDGGFVASGRAPLEFATLGPGDESPFQVTVPAASGVERYRVSFRNESGVVRHLDRRRGGLNAAAVTR